MQTAPSLISLAGEQCPACEAPLATDQRYCLECGARRGEPRLPLMSAPVPPAPPAAPPARPPRPSSATTVIAGVATLLIAMGVGVLIGRTGQTPAPAAKQAYTISVPSAGTTTAAATATPSATPTRAAATKKKPAKTTKSKPPASPTATPPPTVKVGSPGKGRGYKNGKFTGDFFGP